MNWLKKCVLDSMKAVLPFQVSLRSLKDRVVPYQPDIEENLHTIDQGLQQVKWISQAVEFQGVRILEIGSGWEPLIPIIYSLAGASRVYMTDLNVLLRADTFEAALQSLRSRKTLLIAELGLDPAVLDHALRNDPTTSLTDRLAELRLTYMAPCDCRKLNLLDASVDAVSSRACFEHVPSDVIRDICHESFRLLRVGGVACHVIDHSDHWEHYDKALTRINFLKYSDSLFKWTYINPLNYQNRLRHPEYIEMLDNAGFKLVREEHKIDQTSLKSLPLMPVNERFKRFSPEDLATVGSWLLAVKRRDS